MPLTTTRLGLDRAELATTVAAVAVSSGLFVAFGHPYLARGVVGDLLGFAALAAVVVARRRRLRHEALVCLAGIALVAAVRPQWPLRLSGEFWWSAVAVGLAAYVAARQRRLRAGP